MVLIKWGKISLAGCVVRERPSLPADVTVSELLYMLAIRAPRQGEKWGRREEGRKEAREGRGGKQRRAGNDRGGESRKGEVDGGREKRESENKRKKEREKGSVCLWLWEEEEGSEVAAY